MPLSRVHSLVVEGRSVIKKLKLEEILAIVSEFVVFFYVYDHVLFKVLK